MPSLPCYPAGLIQTLTYPVWSHKPQKLVIIQITTNVVVKRPNKFLPSYLVDASYCTSTVLVVWGYTK